jgi:hypothetical protein
LEGRSAGARKSRAFSGNTSFWKAVAGKAVHAVMSTLHAGHNPSACFDPILKHWSWCVARNALGSPEVVGLIGGTHLRVGESLRVHRCAPFLNDRFVTWEA